MSIKKILSASTAFAVTIGIIDVPLATARGGGHSFGGASHFQSVHVQNTRPHVTVTRQARLVSHKPKHVEKVARLQTSAHKHKDNDKIRHKDSDRVRHKDHDKSLGKVAINKTLVHATQLKGRLTVPQGLKPKFTVTKLANTQFQKKMGPFVQKYWKQPFFWVALAGIGYVTVPELYYDRFLGCIADEEYDGCVTLLSMAALDEDEPMRVRYPMPARASYRYSASIAPSAVAGSPAEAGAVRGVAANNCSLAPFVERKWNSAFVWVRIPETGNVTVPEDYYDRFEGAVASSPPNYQAACAVLVEAAAADMMTMAGTMSDSGTEQVN